MEMRRERERERERKRETDRQTDRQTETETERQRDLTDRVCKLFNELRCRSLLRRRTLLLLFRLLLFGSCSSRTSAKL